MNNRFSVQRRRAWRLMSLPLIAALVLAGTLSGMAAPLPQESVPFDGISPFAPRVQVTQLAADAPAGIVLPFDRAGALPFAPAERAGQPAAPAEDCQQVLGNTAFDMVGSNFAPWGILTAKVYYSTAEYVSPLYSLLVVDADEGDTSPTQDAFGQIFDMPADLTSITIEYSTATANSNAADEAYGNLWTANSSGELIEYIAGWEIADSPGAWEQNSVSSEDPELLADMAGQHMAIILFNSTDGAAPGEAAFFDDVSLTACTAATAVTKTFAPLILRNAPVVSIPPSAPVLEAISNEDGDGNYTVSWSASSGATTYTLQEATDPAFSGAATVYSGAKTSAALSGRDLGTYYYRVRASNAAGDSGWSSVQSVQVTNVSAIVPVDGPWTGTTSQDREISFNIVSNGTMIDEMTINVGFGGACGGVSSVTYYLYNTAIDDASFYGTGTNGTYVQGDFTSATSAEGDFYAVLQVDYPSYCRTTRSGTWTATP